jgi:hypothetical protein
LDPALAIDDIHHLQRNRNTDAHEHVERPEVNVAPVVFSRDL